MCVAEGVPSCSADNALTAAARVGANISVVERGHSKPPTPISAEQ